MKLKDFYFELPEELIAQEPLIKRDNSRLMVLDRESGTVTHRVFSDIKDYLKSGDCLVLNDTRVLPARLFGRRKSTGAAIEILLLERKSLNRWECLVKPGKKCRVGDIVTFGEEISEGNSSSREDDVINEENASNEKKFELECEILEIIDGGNRIIEFRYEGAFEAILDKLGKMPLPPYITKELVDRERYQTIYSKYEGSAAAPTAGLHFTPELIEEIKSLGVRVVFVTLHVGLGTFRPVKIDNIKEHKMHEEHYSVSEETAKIINETKFSGGRVFCVGTTSVRTLESVTKENSIVQAGSGSTGIFIYPGYKFKVADVIITNFHLPESTLLMLISAFSSRENVLNAYKIAVEEKYRFFSFGDAMLII